MKFISKKDQWFDVGTEAEITQDTEFDVVHCSNCGKSCKSAIFLGYRRGDLDEELCSFCEFDIAEDKQ